MAKSLEELLKTVGEKEMSADEAEAQRQSFVYGNTHFENESITRDTVKRASQKLKEEQGDGAI